MFELNLIKSLKNLIKNDVEARFRLVVAFKFAIIPIISFIILLLLSYVLLSTLLLIMDSFEVDKNFIAKDLLWDFVSGSIASTIPWIMGLFVGLYILGLLVGSYVIRPFRTIAEYCEKRVQGEDASYDPGFYTDLKLLSSFSEWFFSTIEIVDGKMIDLPKRYKGIHKPVFETNFFIHNFVITFLVTIVTALAIHYLSLEVFEDVVAIVDEIYIKEIALKKLLANLYNIFILISNIAILFNFFLYMGFSINLYSKISTPAFGVFATMRSFISGRRSARVHLIGYPYIRDYTRILNKYLDQVCQTSELQNIDKELT